MNMDTARDPCLASVSRISETIYVEIMIFYVNDRDDGYAV
jgi:hypothetical protein